MQKTFVRKLSKRNKYTYNITIPKELIEEFNWREKQKLVVRPYGQGILIRDWKKIKKKTGKRNK